jgi:protein gp37
MSGKSAIEWTDATWNPVTGCTRVSPGCAHCYIETTIPFRTQHRRFVRKGSEETTGLILHDERIDTRRVPKGPRVFVNSLSDLFHEEIPDEFVWRVFDLMRLLPDRQFQVLTKRPERMREVVEGYYRLTARGVGTDGEVEYPLPNVWLGVSIENARFTWRADVLREIPAAVRFISAEPLLGSLFPKIESRSRSASRPRSSHEPRHEPGAATPRAALDLTGIDWLIVGGESGGREARPMHPEWARELRDACLGPAQEPCSFCSDESNAPLHVWRMCACDCHPKRTGPAFFFKQWGSWAATIAGTYLAREGQDYVIARGAPYSDFVPDTTLGTGDDVVYYAGVSPKSGGRLLDGREWNEMPRPYEAVS